MEIIPINRPTRIGPITWNQTSLMHLNRDRLLFNLKRSEQKKNLLIVGKVGCNAICSTTFRFNILPSFLSAKEFKIMNIGKCSSFLGVVTFWFLRLNTSTKLFLNYILTQWRGLNAHRNIAKSPFLFFTLLFAFHCQLHCTTLAGSLHVGYQLKMLAGPAHKYLLWVVPEWVRVSYWKNFFNQKYSKQTLN